jgi:hypothetical protein
MDNTFFLSTRGTGPVPRALVTVGSPVEGGVCPSWATAIVTLKNAVSRGGDRSGAASAVPLDELTATVGTPCPLVVLSLISSSTVPLVHLGVGKLPTTIKMKGEFQ